MVVAVTNVVDSSMAREADAVLYTRAGLEQCVVATKTVLAQIAALEMLALRLAQLRGTLDGGEILRLEGLLADAPRLVADVLAREGQVASVVGEIAQTRDFFFLGRNVGYPTALEGALKLKEITYVHAEGYPAGELKHGPLALIEPGVVVVAMVTDAELRDKLMSNLEEVKARGATTIALAHDGDEGILAVADFTISLPATDPVISPLVDIVALQQLAYLLAKERGLNVDRPRNLAKTVTVE
jgi:glucosamine--fructose-6-phosphate aminotransferase (isomerizing)